MRKKGPKSAMLVKNLDTPKKYSARIFAMDGFEACRKIGISRKKKKLRTSNFYNNEFKEYSYHWIQFKVNLFSYFTHNKPSNTGK